MFFILINRISKKYIYYKQIIINFLKNKKNLHIILYSLGIIFYSLSLDNLKGGDLKCYVFEGIKCMYFLAILVSISSALTSFSVYLILFKNRKKIHLLIISIIYLIFYFIDHNAELLKHGLYNFLAFIIIFIFLFILILFFHFISSIIHKKNYIVILIILFFIFLNYQFRLYKLKHFSCENWSKGFNDSEIDNISKDYPCKIIIPKPNSCYISGIGAYFDFTSLYRPNCSDLILMKKDKTKFLNNIKDLEYLSISDKKHFGYPLTNNEEFSPYEYGSMLYHLEKRFDKDINEKIILMDLYKKDKNKYYPNISTPEIQITLNKNSGKIDIKIDKNKTLIKERENKIKIYKPLYKNILIMFLDTLSRVHFHRKFPKTIKFLKQFSHYEKNPEKKNMTIFQYFKYNSLNTFTRPNLKAAYYGAKPDGEGIFFAKYFKKKGYILGRVNTFCSKESVFDKNNKTSLEHVLWDHEGLSLACIESFYDGILTSKLSSLMRKCLFGKDINEYSIEYLKAFWTTYINQYKLFLFQSLEGHEPTGELIGYFDEILYNFLNLFHNKGYLKDTVIIIFSDHGLHLSGPLYLFDSQDFINEITLPLLLLIIPNDNKLYENNLYEKMRSNQQTFITPFDIYNTLIYLSLGKDKEEYERYSVPYGSSLFSQINYKERFCESSLYQSLIGENICKCKLKN